MYELKRFTMKSTRGIRSVSKPDLNYAVYFVGQIHSRSICEMDMADISREFEKIKKLQDIDKVVIQNPPEEK